VTLRCHDEAIAWHFEQLRDAILGATGDAHSFTRVFDALVMETINQYFSLAQYIFHAAAGFNSDVMRKMSARQMPMRVRDAVGMLVADVLVKATSQCYIDELHATADAQYRYVFPERPGRQGHFEFIKLQVSFLGQWMNIFSIATRVQVYASRQQQSVEAGKEGMKCV